MSPSPPVTAQPIDPSDFKLDNALAEQGRDVYAAHCLWSHGSDLVLGGGTPDLRKSPIAASHDAFRAVLVDSAKVAKGMSAFKEFGDTQVDAMLHFIRLRA